ncbi:YihY/virulence factor BrkB family protein [uncultured Oxalicibacterium sp.]|uniref:YihY/virulence factor BrkB family protein n=1 Tax=uncultured Oxalicibacterium sp. TaxID=1168540 RepID=UPI0025CC03CE|nr:YihY/virulence factor BrkB family protein [uncultured Oxalicibacterium sp.]
MNNTLPADDSLPKKAWLLTRDAVMAWVDDFAPSMGAALAYYTIFSLAPMLVIVIAIAGFFFGQEAAQGEILLQLRDMVGTTAASAIEGLLRSASEPGQGIIAATLGIVTLVIGATAVFAELQSALDRIWKIPPDKKGGVVGLLRKRLLSFGMVMALGFMLMISLLLSAILAALGKWWSSMLGGWTIVLEALNISVSFGIVIGLFAMIYKFMPRASIPWRDVWVGAIVTALLFTIGKFAIGLYLGKASIASSFGAAGSLVVLLAWVYYSAQIFLLGAEFTRVFALRYGSLARMKKAVAAEDDPLLTRS